MCFDVGVTARSCIAGFTGRGQAIRKELRRFANGYDVAREVQLPGVPSWRLMRVMCVYNVNVVVVSPHASYIVDCVVTETHHTYHATHTHRGIPHLIHVHHNINTARTIPRTHIARYHI